jgi:hypothetical protein
MTCGTHSVGPADLYQAGVREPLHLFSSNMTIDPLLRLIEQN